MDSRAHDSVKGVGRRVCSQTTSAGMAMRGEGGGGGVGGEQMSESSGGRREHTVQAGVSGMSLSASKAQGG